MQHAYMVSRATVCVVGVLQYLVLCGLVKSVGGAVVFFGANSHFAIRQVITLSAEALLL